MSVAVEDGDRSAEIDQVSTQVAMLCWHLYTWMHSLNRIQSVMSRCRANVEHGTRNGSVLSGTCRSLTWLMQLRWGHVAAWLSSFSASWPVDQHSSRRDWRLTCEPVWRRSRHRASIRYSVVVAAGNNCSEWGYVLVQWQVRSNSTPSTQTVSDDLMWAPPSVIEGPPSGIFNRLCLAPVYISSLLSALSQRQFAAIHCSMAATHCSALAAADCTTRQWMYSWWYLGSVICHYVCTQWSVFTWDPMCQI